MESTNSNSLGSGEKHPVFLWLATFSIVSLFLTTATNRGVGAVLESIRPGLAVISETCIPSVSLIFLISIVFLPKRIFVLPSAKLPWIRLAWISIIWLSAWIFSSWLYARSHGGWHAYAVSTPALVGFLVFGPLGEELLFRGIVFELAERAFPTNLHLPIVFSTALFSIHHFELHGFHANDAALWQVGFTIPMGYVLGKIRHLSSNVWPGVILHFLTNLPHVFGSV